MNGTERQRGEGRAAKSGPAEQVHKASRRTASLGASLHQGPEGQKQDDEWGEKQDDGWMGPSI